MKDLLEELEKNINNETLYIKSGKLPILITASHTIRQHKSDRTLKLPEPYTRAIATYLATKYDLFCIIKNTDTYVDANSLEKEEMKTEIINTINNNDIKLVLDLHGASYTRKFDIELGNLRNLSADFSTTKELQEAFQESGIDNVTINSTFPGGGITKTIYGNSTADVIQIEINHKFRDIEDISKLKLVCNALSKFIEQYSYYFTK